MVTRVKIGYGGFNPVDKSSATKSFKRSWQAEKPGSEISFRFYGNAVKIAMWQRRDSMGIIHAYVDGDKVIDCEAMYVCRATVPCKCTVLMMALNVCMYVSVFIILIYFASLTSLCSPV